MTYLLSQMFFYLVCALLLGLLLGWVIWGWWGRRLIAEARSEGEQALRDQRQKCDAEKAELQATIDNQAKALEGAQARSAKAPEAKSAKSEKLTKSTKSEKSSTSKKFVTDAPRPASLYQSRPSDVDDLKKVKGIGPVMERILNENGCYHFKQLANFSQKDIEWISAAIATFPDRIERDRWVEQAQSLYHEKYGK